MLLLPCCLTAQSKSFKKTYKAWEKGKRHHGQRRRLLRHLASIKAQGLLRVLRRKIAGKPYQHLGATAF